MMIDMERTIEGLKEVSDFLVKEYENAQAEEANLYYDRFLAVDNAVSLLKEQEEQSVLSNRVCEVEPFRYVRKGFCQKCHQEMEWLFNRKHCGFCGQAVKWK